MPVPDGPQITRFSFRSIHSRLFSARWVGLGMEDRPSSQAWKVFPVGKPAALRLIWTEEARLPATSSVRSALTTSAGSQRWILAVASRSGAMRRICGSRRMRSWEMMSSMVVGVIGFRQSRLRQ